MFRKTIALALALLLSSAPFPAQGKASPPPRIKVSCIGNSITYGLRLEDRERESYPARLQRLLGDGYEVGNFGKPGATLLRRGHRPYLDQEEFRRAMDFAGDIVVIHLGINDTDPRDWPYYRDDFAGDYLALIDSLRSVNPRARFLLARMTPIASGHPRFLSGTRDWHGQIQEAIEAVAHAAGAELIDFHEPLYPCPWMLPDGVHPDAEGALILARTVYEGITGDYGGLRMSRLFSDHMVLPRDRSFPIRGRADAGERVTVRADGAVFRTVADNRGRWSLTLPPHPAGEGSELRVETPGCVLVYADVAYGDIWLCSGQSNMEFRVGEASDSEVRADAGLRLYDMKGRWDTYDRTWPAAVLDSVNHLDFFPSEGLHAADGGEITGFEVLDAADGRYHPVSVKAVTGCVVQLDVTGLREVAAVRYGWQPYTRANLSGGTGLPASTFRMEVR